ncbi:MAG TPA: helix-turn-helix transcriptional regulator [Gemmataceae bacterium]|nr:helix-turn-helix transcriptional regulator [Gemmataceae bacterium]
MTHRARSRTLPGKGIEGGEKPGNPTDETFGRGSSVLSFRAASTEISDRGSQPVSIPSRTRRLDDVDLNLDAVNPSDRQSRKRGDSVEARKEDSSSDLPYLLSTLKQLFSSQGIIYADIALQLNVSESTVKRYLAGRGLSAQILERLCRVLDLGLADVADIMLQKQNRKATRLSSEQEFELTRDCFTSFVFYLLRCGWTPREIQEEFQLSEAETVLYLTRLDHLRLISLLPHNRIRLLTVRDPEWQRGGPMQRLFDAFIRQEFTSLNYLDPKVLSGLETLKLSGASLVHLKDMIAEFTERVQRLAESDQRLRHKQTSWYSVLLAARPVDPAALRGRG